MAFLWKSLGENTTHHSLKAFNNPNELIEYMIKKFGYNKDGCENWNMIIKTYNIPYHDTVPGLVWPQRTRINPQTGQIEKFMCVDILDRQEGLDLWPHSVAQGIRILGHPFGKLKSPTWFLDPASTAIVRAYIATQDNTSPYPYKCMPQLELALQLVPPMFEETAAEHKAGRQPRNPNVIAARLLGEMHRHKECFRSACKNHPKYYEHLVEVCQHFSQGAKEIYYRE